ncbi:hypothetical protein Pla100_50010 [Neorhodopirellula pilleata]|uniref:Uncharacterized protein n=1 Tax=Neorhodopirellula pilleata TaxID=2714738 RepID=A0A5C5ZWX5_9BACT|nr:hypothetical protein Pla100_50010 [Neorhodopirellula pilleata]
MTFVQPRSAMLRRWQMLSHMVANSDELFSPMLCGVPIRPLICSYTFHALLLGNFGSVLSPHMTFSLQNDLRAKSCDILTNCRLPTCEL